MSSAKHCCVPGCSNMKGHKEGSHTALHMFPNPDKDRNRFNTWLYAISGDILDQENERIYKYRRVCHSHFDEKYFCRNDRINNIAVPTLNMPDTLPKFKFTYAERRPMKETTNLSQASTSKAVTLHHHHDGLAVREDVDKGAVQKENIVPQIQSQKEMLFRPNSLVTGEGEKISVQQNLESNVMPLEQVQLVPSNPPVMKHSQHDLGGRRTAAKKRTRRLFFTEKERELHATITSAKIKIYKLRSRVKRQTAELKAAKKIASDPSALKLIENCSIAAKMLMQIQWRENKKNEKGRRFTLQEKILALSILKQSPKGYKFFRSIFILPSPQTLIKLVQDSNLQPGINKNIYKQLQKRASCMKVEEKLCILLFDEVSLKAQITYNERKDKIIGFVDNGKERMPEFADHAQVFMVRGLVKNYKQPVAYTFSASATKGPELAAQIKQVITELQQAGLIVMATVCDQGTNNSSAIKFLINETRGVFLRSGEEPKENVMLINNHEIIPLYDPPHLLKGIRNNLLTKNLQYTKEGILKIAKWSHLKQLYNENPGYKGIRMIPKLTKDHINPEGNKMKVKYASQIFSRTVASNMGYLADKNILPTECKETADFLLIMDNLFDSVNGSYQKNKFAKPLLGPATPSSAHFKTWKETKKILLTVKFITASGKVESVPSVANWVWTLNGIEILLSNLREKYGVTSVWLRHLNQDPLENFFGAIRSHGCRNTNPTCDQFEGAFATLLINSQNSVHTRGKNCEVDLCDTLYDLVIDGNAQSPLTCNVNLNIDIIPIQEKEKDPRVIGPLQYVSGYFLKMLKSHVYKDCQECETVFKNKNEIEYIKYREYAGQRWLCYPSNQLIEIISNLQDLINQILKQNLEQNMIREVIKTTAITVLDFAFVQCNTHKERVIDYLLNLACRFMIFHYCKNTSKILAGRRDVDDDDDMYQMKAKKYFKKCYKRKK